MDTGYPFERLVPTYQTTQCHYTHAHKVNYIIFQDKVYIFLSSCKTEILRVFVAT